MMLEDDDVDDKTDVNKWNKLFCFFSRDFHRNEA